MDDIEIAKRCGAVCFSTYYAGCMVEVAFTTEQLTAFREAVTKELREQVVAQQARIELDDALLEMAGLRYSDAKTDYKSVLAAHDAELLAAKDAEIAELKECSVHWMNSYYEAKARIDAADKKAEAESDWFICSELPDGRLQYTQDNADEEYAMQLFTRPPITPAREKELLEQNLRILRGEFTQICSHCGWEASAGGASWDELQEHIKVCPEHPVPKLLEQIVGLERNVAFYKHENEEKSDAHNARMIELAALFGEDVSDEPRYKWVYGIVSDAARELERLRGENALMSNQRYELMGAIADIEQGKGFDSVCLSTIKRVCDALSTTKESSASWRNGIEADALDSCFAELENHYSTFFSDGESNLFCNMMQTVRNMASQKRNGG